MICRLPLVPVLLAVLAPLAVTTVTACGDGDTPAPDAAVPDAAAPDAAVPDAAAPDAATPDAAAPDAATPDAATPDDPLTSCHVPRPCPAPTGGKVSVCGRISDIASDTPLGGATVDVASFCDSSAPTTDGPCALEVKFFDPLAMFATPDLTAPLTFDSLDLDVCGRFAGTNITRPFNGFIAVVVDDPSGSTGDIVKRTAVAFQIEANEQRRNVVAYSTPNAVDARWTETAGAPFGKQSFADRGVVVSRFRHGGAPAPGATVTSGGSARPDTDFYLTSGPSGPNDQVDTALSTTGPSGTSLLVDSSLAQHSGVGGEPAGCEWESQLAASTSGIVYVQSVRAVVTDTDETCPSTSPAK